jgi:hypothetical protein
MITAHPNSLSCHIAEIFSKQAIILHLSEGFSMAPSVRIVKEGENDEKGDKPGTQ